MKSLFWFLVALGVSGPALAGELPEYLTQAVAAPDRPEKDRERDEDRKPAQVLHFFGIKPGQQVVELMAGQGYYVDIISRVVGKQGKAYAQNNAFVLERFAEKGLSERLKNPNLANVSRIDAELDALPLPNNLDAVLMILFYHDTYWQEVDRARMNQAVYDALKPGGIFGIVDHYAEDGSGDRDVKTIHRMDIALVKKELKAAGFELVGSSEVLRHPEDDRTLNVFQSEIRGKTDRFVLKFRKPM